MAISFSVHSSREDRPVLPPLHTLALPTFPAQTRLPGIHALNATHDPDVNIISAYLYGWMVF